MKANRSGWAAAAEAKALGVGANSVNLWHHYGVKRYNWDPSKNEKLKAERNISFEEIVFHIERGDEVDIFEHPNQKQYPGQKISVVLIEGYAYLVPYVESETEIFLKSIIPSRKATKKYVRDQL